MKALYVLLIFCLILTACGKEKAETAAGNVIDDTHKPTMEVTYQINGTELSIDVATNMLISPEHYGLARETGEGHIHMYLDNGEKIGVKEGHKVFKNLPAGSHTLKISLHNNDHTPYDVTKMIDFDIK